MWEATEDVHTEKLVKAYHQRHPLESLKDKTGHGTKRLIHTLYSLAATPSPTQRVASWLLHSSMPPIRHSPESPLTLRSSSDRQSTSIGHLQPLSIVPSMTTPSSTPASATTRTASITPPPEPWLTRHPQSTTPPTSRPPMTRSRAAHTLWLPTTPNTLIFTPPPKKLSTPCREHPSPQKLPLLPNNSYWTGHPGPTTTRGPLPPLSLAWSTPQSPLLV